MFALQSYAQILSLRHLSTDDGLPQNSINTIIQDKNDFIWFGTEEGVAKYDGTDFTIYGQKNGLPHRHIRIIFEDSKGNIWVGTNNGVALYSQAKNKFENQNKKVEFLNNTYIYSIAESQDSTIYFASTNGLISYKRGKFSHFTKKQIPFLPDSLSTLFVDNENTLWVGTTSNGLWKAENCRIRQLKKENTILDKKINALIQDSKSRIWITTKNNLYRLNKSDKNSLVKKILSNMTDNVEFSFLLEDFNHKIWLGSKENGLYVYDGDFTHYKTENGLKTLKLISGIQDKRGDIWLGYRDGGVDRLPIENFEIYDNSVGLASNVVFGISRDVSGRMWFGHLSEGVSTIFQNKSTIISEKQRLPGSGAAAFLQFDRERFYIGAKDGLALVKEGKIVSVSPISGIDRSAIILKLFKLNEDTIWVGTSNGLRIFSVKSNRFFNSDKKFEKMNNAWVSAFLKAKDGTYWFATDPRGVFHLVNDTLENFTVVEGLNSNTVNDISQDKFGNLWFSTDNGLTKYDGENFISLTTENGLPSNQCYFAMVDGDFLYVGTPSGLARVNYILKPNQKNYEIKIYSKRDGLANTECNLFGYYKDAKGNLYFGSQGGVTKFNPNAQPRLFPSSTYIRNLRIISDETEFDTVSTSTLNLDYNYNNITIDYRGVVFADAGRIQYMYKLEGIDKTWTETKEHSVSFRALPPGSYTFMVKCRNQDGIWSDEYAQASFIIHPPFWDTWWFRTVFVLVILGSIYGFFIFKTSQVKKRNLELSILVRERTKELQLEKDKTDELIHNILPSDAVTELKTNGFVKPRLFESVTILFTDFKGFTAQAAILHPNDLVDELNKIFLAFDKIVEEYGLEKLKTIGDSYMAACGLPKISEDHAEKVVSAAIRMQEYIKENESKFKIKWEMRAGVHTGTVVAGVVGSKKFTYDIWGDTVNIASRMESSGVSNEVNISASTYELVKDIFDCEYRGMVDAKGKGKMKMYLAKRKTKNVI